MNLWSKPFTLILVMTVLVMGSLTSRGQDFPSLYHPSSTGQVEARLDADLTGVWALELPRERVADFVWLHPNGEFVMRDMNCSVTARGTWSYPSMILELAFPDGDHISLTVSRVPKTWTGGEYVVFNVQRYVWQFMTRDTGMPC